MISSSFGDHYGSGATLGNSSSRCLQSSAASVEKLRRAESTNPVGEPRHITHPYSMPRAKSPALAIIRRSDPHYVAASESASAGWPLFGKLARDGAAFAWRSRHAEPPRFPRTLFACSSKISHSLRTRHGIGTTRHARSSGRSSTPTKAGSPPLELGSSQILHAPRTDQNTLFETNANRGSETFLRTWARGTERVRALARLRAEPAGSAA